MSHPKPSRGPSTTDSCPVGMRGIVPSLNTPFTADDRIDTAALRRVVDVTIGAGCAGMLICAVAGETGSLTPAERETVMRTVLEQTAGRIPVIVGVTHPDAATRAMLAKQAKTLGAPWVLCQPPAGVRGKALLPVFQALADAGPEHLMIQDLDFTGPGMALEDITMLFGAVPQFQALKIETLPAGPKYTHVLEATGGKLHVSGGWAVMQMLEALRRGVHAFIPSTLDPVYRAI
ncbi:MAG TPA: dihydrodipicolinate synthase family protein, partial [bacterium]